LFIDLPKSGDQPLKIQSAGWTKEVQSSEDIQRPFKYRQNFQELLLKAALVSYQRVFRLRKKARKQWLMVRIDSRNDNWKAIGTINQKLLLSGTSLPRNIVGFDNLGVIFPFKLTAGSKSATARASSPERISRTTP
jgi:hypothetical protein